MFHRLPHTTQLAPERPMFVNSFGHIHSVFFLVEFRDCCAGGVVQYGAVCGQQPHRLVRQKLSRLGRH